MAVSIWKSQTAFATEASAPGRIPVMGQGAAVSAGEYRAHQPALLDQALKVARGTFDPTVALLRCPRDPRFWLVQESLAFAALLLSRQRATGVPAPDTALALKIIDAVLQSQNRKILSSDHGTFPLLWSPDRRQRSVPDPESREILGSMLAVLLEDHAVALGAARSDAVREAVRRAVRPADAPPADSLTLSMLSAWLDLKFGDRFRGEQMARTLAEHEPGAWTAQRVGNPRAYALELWALSLWQRSPRLLGNAEERVCELLGEAVSYVHPRMPEMFGAATTSTSARDDQFPWLGAWLTWHALGPAPLLPKAFSDPHLATLYALPVTANVELPASVAKALESKATAALTLDMAGHQLTGWSEPALLIEARESPLKRLPYTPVIGARWQTSCGRNAWLRCLTADAQRARCRERFVHIEQPGQVTVEVFNLGPGGARLTADGWWLSGLHFATDGLQFVHAERTERCLSLTLRPLEPEALVMFTPLS